MCVRPTWAALSASSRNSGPRSWRLGSTAPSREIHTFTSTSYTPRVTSSTCRDETSSWGSSQRRQTGTETHRQHAHKNKHRHCFSSLSHFCFSVAASLALRCVCLTCSSSLMSSRAALKSRNPPSLFGLLCRTKRCPNRGIVMQSVCEQILGKILQWCFAEHLSHTHIVYLLPCYKLQLSIRQQLHYYSANILIQPTAAAKRTPLALCFSLSLDFYRSLSSLSILQLSLFWLFLCLQTRGMCSAGIQI